jgi:hypothetical protein
VKISRNAETFSASRALSHWFPVRMKFRIRSVQSLTSRTFAPFEKRLSQRKV